MNRALLALALLGCSGSHPVEDTGVDVRDATDSSLDVHDAHDADIFACSPCRAHLTREGCRDDVRCEAIRSLFMLIEPCNWDERGFADNCPFVGCRAVGMGCIDVIPFESLCRDRSPVDAYGCYVPGNGIDCPWGGNGISECSRQALCSETPSAAACEFEHADEIPPVFVP